MGRWSNCPGCCTVSQAPSVKTLYLPGSDSELSFAVGPYCQMFPHCPRKPAGNYAPG